MSACVWNCGRQLQLLGESNFTQHPFPENRWKQTWWSFKDNITKQLNSADLINGRSLLNKTSLRPSDTLLDDKERTHVIAASYM